MRNVTDSGGRTVLVYPEIQMVDRMVSGLTRESTDPGVQSWYGSPFRLVHSLVFDRAAGAVAGCAISGLAAGAAGWDAGAVHPINNTSPATTTPISHDP